MSEAVERLAVVLAERQCALDQAKAEQASCDIMLLPSGYIDWARGEARAAIQALRTPDESILKILREGLVMDGYEPHPGQPEKIWDRCIDALLNTPPTT